MSLRVVLVVATPISPGKNNYFSPFPPVFYPPFGCFRPPLLLLVLMCIYRCGNSFYCKDRNIGLAILFCVLPYIQT